MPPRPIAHFTGVGVRHAHRESVNDDGCCIADGAMDLPWPWPTVGAAMQHATPDGRCPGQTGAGVGSSGGGRVGWDRGLWGPALLGRGLPVSRPATSSPQPAWAITQPVTTGECRPTCSQPRGSVYPSLYRTREGRQSKGEGRCDAGLRLLTQNTTQKNTVLPLSLPLRIRLSGCGWSLGPFPPIDVYISRPTHLYIQHVCVRVGAVLPSFEESGSQQLL